MGYAFATWGNLKTALAGRLGDTHRIYWTDSGAPYGDQYSELNLYLTEALRVWSCLTGFYRARGAFSTTSGIPFYNLTSQLPALLGYTATDRQVAAILEYHLIEPLSVDGTWRGSQQYTADDIIKAIQRRRNQFLADTGCVLNRNSTLAVPPSPIGRVQLPDTYINVQRLAWTDSSTGNTSPIWPADEYSATGSKVLSQWTDPTTPPVSYSIVSTPPITLQLIQPPLASGSLDVLYVGSGNDVSLVVETILGIPDDFAWVVKWGALADLLYREGIAYDPARARFCETQYRLGVEIAKAVGCVVQAEINGVPLYPSELAGFDAGNPYWQSIQGTPDSMALVGNFMALSNCPDAPYGVAVDVIGKAPIPTSDNDFIQIGREHVDAILDYACHLAAFKQAGAEFTATIPQAEQFMRNAVALNNRIDASTLFDRQVEEQSKNEYGWRKRERVGPGVGTMAVVPGDRK